MKKTLVLALVFSSSLFWLSSVFADYSDVECTSNPVFAANSCNQCFNGGAKSQGDTLGLLSDQWQNVSNVKQIAYKEEQKLPFMVNLSEGTTTWTQIPDAEGFWEYTEAFNALYDNKEEWYILNAGQSVEWLKSKLGYGYRLENNTANQGDSIGLLVYPFKTHNIMESWEITIDDTEHRECVLFTSGATPTTPVTPTPTEPKPELPKTGPEHIILIALALLLWFGLIVFTKKA